MSGYVVNIEEKTEQNEFFRQVLFTTKRSQLVVMALQPGEDIGAEVHEDHDQFIRGEVGDGKAIMDGVESDLGDGSAVVIPAGVDHNIINTGDTVMKLYTVYTPPEHIDGTVHQTKAEALADHHE